MLVFGELKRKIENRLIPKPTSLKDQPWSGPVGENLGKESVPTMAAFTLNKEEKI